MARGVDRLIAYRTMRAVEKLREAEQPPVPEEKKTSWQRWQDRVNRLGDKMLGA